ncbi:hypothetical protein amad1_04450 [Alteromonas mediterranea DE1]|uniref:HEPN domain-containing protein n=2 Tax=Alteromonas mediterranea TaxID=314275 RepID=A0AAC9ACU1_9ALTE|nr:hypothetical protein [Alteromonas mediterranea]AFV84414.1 hypothetical protein amad1_04450 [Alteromonas mediterranea DE1]AGP96421.1 hypothetical protein I635_04420 [Alteromonas mediterranea UM7]AMJ77604.1 hypothetical protein AV942_04380 [Alteromonas mediterranea]AMJ81749.1 hypothetical protein AV941_04400 [Alteromonas mediterranea]HBL21760.1 hypothetical protein [Alteromonas mediterranea]|tara:strand:- start:2158 stop:2658 length:501 start_codon:yes stop_codon:yes gene_type:complete
MQYVGSELERLALIDTDPNNADLLGRSAFNRYYYAAFLITRETLGYMQPNWKGTPHANIPELLITKLKKPAKPALTKQRRSGLITPGEESRLLSGLSTTASELAQLLTQAYDARILADYEPEIKTTKDKNVICLKSHKLTTARQWPEQADRYCARLKRIWKEIGLA